VRKRENKQNDAGTGKDKKEKAAKMPLSLCMN
jgi:hypothetical protein